MQKINILSDELANKIAAGEVVERPASVVKELLENSIDANSKNIKIIIKEFGIKEIRIIDNGVGISNADIENAFLRHATSKIKNSYDLFHIETLGFRGEALASIASVSNIEIKSCASEVQGKLVELHGGKIIRSEFYAPIKGTDIKVSNLFYNTPARLKYLKNPHTEQVNINNVVYKLALANPQIAFELLVDDKIVLKTYGDNDEHKVLSKIYNVGIAKNMLSFSGYNDDYEVTGYISNPEETRSNKNYISIFINGRYIKNYALQNAIVEGYGNFLMKNRYPIAVLNIKMDPILVDVNVHPTKQEVRLSKEDDLTTLVKQIISNRLINNTYIPSGINNVLKKDGLKTEQLSYINEIDSNYTFNETSIVENNYLENINDPLHYVDNNIESKVKKNDRFSKFSKNTLKKETENFLDFIKSPTLEIEEDNKGSYTENTKTILKENNEENTFKTLPDLDILSQIFKTYILAQTGDELYLIDQHAAQERYNYEKIRRNFVENIKYKTQLLIPLTFDFYNEDLAFVEDLKFKLYDIGIILEEFGENNYIVRDYPRWMEKDPENIIKDIIEKLKINKKLTVEELADDVIALASCKASIKANQSLSLEEMKKVVADLYSCENPFTCPHGRPIISKLTKKDLEKMFKRIV